MGALRGRPSGAPDNHREKVRSLEGLPYSEASSPAVPWIGLGAVPPGGLPPRAAAGWQQQGGLSPALVHFHGNDLQPSLGGVLHLFLWHLSPWHLLALKNTG